MDIDKEKCTECKKCEQVCPMAVKVTENINSAECIRCGRCRASCPEEAIEVNILKIKTGTEPAVKDEDNSLH